MSLAVPGPWQPLVESVAARLLEASLWGAGLALGVWALCALVPELPAVWRRWLWWGVALKLLLALAPVPRVALPVLAPVEAPAARSVVAGATVIVPEPGRRNTRAVAVFRRPVP